MTPRQEVEELLLEWEDGCLDETGRQRIRDLVKSSVEARQAYVQHQFLNVALNQTLSPSLSPAFSDAVRKAVPGPMFPDEDRQPGPASTVSPASTFSPVGTVSPAGRSSAWPVRWLVISAVLLLSVTARLVYVEWSADRTIPGAVPVTGRADVAEDKAYGVAQVTQLIDGELRSGQSELRPGDAIPPGQISLSGGITQIEFFCGATVIVEGPARMDLKSPLLAEVLQGRLRAQVPPAARGFSLKVKDLQVVDLGTEFALAVSDQSTDVQVFDGEVELHSEHQDLTRLTAGQGVSIDREGAATSAAIKPDQFVNIEQMQSRVRHQNAARFEQWERWSEGIRSDPRLLLYYSFQNQDAGRRLPDVRQSADGELDGAIVGANRVNGRWSGKRALDFKRPGDRVRLQVPGEFQSLTFAAWVRIDSLDKPFNSLFLTDNYNRGEPHWQILGDGRMYFSVRPSEQGQPGPRDHKVLSKPFWKPSMSGQWIHLATTFDVTTARATHFLNGRAIHSEVIPADRLVRTTRIGPASLGNWSLPTLPNAEFAIRNLNGSMDEFLLFSAALSPEEIHDIYENGRP